eukprot:357733-Chlamydomonas_euryale.AAC.6
MRRCGRPQRCHDACAALDGQHARRGHAHASRCEQSNNLQAKAHYITTVIARCITSITQPTND